jgi:hypothetical protein
MNITLQFITNTVHETVNNNSDLVSGTDEFAFRSYAPEFRPHVVTTAR